VPHHKLVDDALRQAQGHYAMVDALFATIAPDRQNELAGLVTIFVAFLMHRLVGSSNGLSSTALWTCRKF
jgi:hypothetical protein